MSVPTAGSVDPGRDGAPHDERLFVPTREQLTVVGKGVPVTDAVQKVTGRLQFAVDFAVAHMAHGKILRSPHPHARIVHIDTSRAEALPGVLGVVTHEDAPSAIWENAYVNYRGQIFDGIARFVGDDIAAVAATDERIAEAALELIDIEWELLPAVFDPEEARKPDAPQIREERNERPLYLVEWGDLTDGEEDADVVVDCDITFRSQQYASIGRNACVAQWNGDHVTVWSSSQTPSEIQDAIHKGFEIPASRVRVIALPSGSSFGQWWVANFQLITVLLARKIGRPVKIELTNEECMATVKRRHIERTRGRMGVRNDGTLAFAQFDHVIDNGGYGFKDDVYFFCCDNWGRASHGRYEIHGVNTNLVTAGCMRGVGDVTLGSAVERTADKIAAKLDIDPIDFRLQNEIRPGDPLRMRHSLRSMRGSVDAYLDGIPEEERQGWPKLFHLASGSTEELLKRGAREFRWSERWKGWGVPHTIDGPVRRAVGVGTGIHCCGVEFGGSTSAIVRINPDGSANVHAACGRQGQGSETTLVQIASEGLGIPLDQIGIETGDTDSCPWSHGSTASNTVYRVGWAIRTAAEDARNQLLEIAGREIFEAAATDLDVRDGRVVPRDHSGPGVPISEVLGVIRSTDTLGQTSSITGRTNGVMPPTTTFARHFAAHFVELEADVETGEIRLLDYLAAQDSGTVVNPQVLKNQAIGGAICGAGFALYEQLHFDGTGKVMNGNFLDYKLLRCADFPYQAKVLFADTYDPVGPFGASGAGEAPIAAADAAVQQAVYNAIGCWVDMPMTPERVLIALGTIEA
jgi:CO/xanthine dehydrogenase Mo-binding subunit